MPSDPFWNSDYRSVDETMGFSLQQRSVHSGHSWAKQDPYKGIQQLQNTTGLCWLRGIYMKRWTSHRESMCQCAEEVRWVTADLPGCMPRQSLEQIAANFLRRWWVAIRLIHIIDHALLRLCWHKTRPIMERQINICNGQKHWWKPLPPPLTIPRAQSAADRCGVNFSHSAILRHELRVPKSEGLWVLSISKASAHIPTRKERQSARKGIANRKLTKSLGNSPHPNKEGPWTLKEAANSRWILAPEKYMQCTVFHWVKNSHHISSHMKHPYFLWPPYKVPNWCVMDMKCILHGEDAGPGGTEFDETANLWSSFSIILPFNQLHAIKLRVQLITYRS